MKRLNVGPAWKGLPKVSLLIMTLAAMTGMVPGQAQAQTGTGNPATLTINATVNILAPILISEDMSLSFGKILPPGTGSQLFTVGTDGSMTVGAGSRQAVSGHRPGQYDITGTNGADYNLTVAFDGCTNVNLNLSGSANNAPVPTKLNQLDIKVGGSLTVASAVPEGTHFCKYSIMAEYR